MAKTKNDKTKKLRKKDDGKIFFSPIGNYKTIFRFPGQKYKIW